MKNYDHKKIEKKWQLEWDKKGIYEASSVSKKPKFYSLIEFPYPSGDGLHIGHPRSYVGMDIVSRKRRMGGYNVLYPIGWDAFGLPTENYAIKTGIQPKIVTKKNTDTFRRQAKSLGISFDWSREINTTDPAYYKWTQWIFLQFLKKGLAYKAKVNINWCPKDKIGLANEEVIDGKCERCGAETIKKEKEQWMLGITKYAERLDKDLDLVDYPERVKISQRNWIGKSEGSEIEFKIKIASSKNFLETAPSETKGQGTHTFLKNSSSEYFVKVFTTRADTLFGATYIVLAPEHHLVESLKLKVENKKEVEKYIEKVKKESELERTSEGKEKTGVELKGIKAISPANQEEIPVYIADYVLVGYGTGAVMAVPAHDDRDFQFAKKYNLPIKQVVEPIFIGDINKDAPTVERDAISAVIKHWSEDKYLCLKWKKADWVTFVTGGIEKGQTPEEAARIEILEETGFLNLDLIQTLPNSHSKFYHIPKKENRFAHFSNFYFKLKDGQQKEISEEEKEKHEVVWLKPEEIEKSLTPEGQKYDFKIINGYENAYTDYGILNNSGNFNSLNSNEAIKKITEFVGGEMVTKFKLRDWVFSRQRYWGEPIPVINCEKCGLVPVKEKDLPVKLPEVKSYKPIDTGESPLAGISKWVKTKCPKCGGKAKRETDTMPNWAGSSWYYLRYTDPKNKKEFASKKNLKYWTPVDWYNGGMEHTTLHLLYSRFWHKFLYDLKLVPTVEPYKKRTSHGMILGEGGVKMSKSLGNVVNPDEIVKTYGADTLRVYEMFIGPFEDTAVWNTESIIGSRRFIEKVWRIGEKVISLASSNFSTLRPSRSTEWDPRVQKIERSSAFQDSILLTKLLHKTIKKVSEDVETMHFNTAISALMILATEMEKVEFVEKEDYKKFLKILAPFAPHIVDDIWQRLGERKSIHQSKWPLWDPEKIIDDEIKIAVQINGKTRAEIVVSHGMNEEEVKSIALQEKNVITWIKDSQIKRIIYVPGKILNIVI